MKSAAALAFGKNHKYGEHEKCAGCIKGKAVVGRCRYQAVYSKDD
jgi:hypothetical protein